MRLARMYENSEPRPVNFRKTPFQLGLPVSLLYPMQNVLQFDQA